VIARDKTVEKVKGKLPRNGEMARKKKVKESGLADIVILGSLKDKYAAIKKYEPGVICLGYDQKVFTENLQEKLFSYGLKNVKIVKTRAYKPHIYKSSKMR
jgi:FAD synthetase